MFMIQNTLYNDILILNASFNGIIHYLKQHERLKDIQKLYIVYTCKNIFSVNYLTVK